MRKALLVVTVSLLLASCSRPAAPRFVSLTRVDPAVTAQRGAGSSEAALRLAAASVVSPQETLLSYSVLFDYLGQRLQRPVEMVQRRSYQETYDLLRFGAADLGLVCTYVYIKGHAEFGLQLLAAPVVNGKAEYRSLIVVRAGSTIQSFAGLAGKRFAFSDPLSNTGYVYPMAVLRESGKDPGSFFTSTTFTYSHDNSIRALLQGVADGAAVDSLVYDQWLTQHPEARERLKVILQSPAFSSPPLVVTPGFDAATGERLQRILLHMHETPEGQAVLQGLGIDRFTAVSDADYASVRDNARQAGMAP